MSSQGERFPKAIESNILSNAYRGSQVGREAQGQKFCLLREEEGSQEAVITGREECNGGRQDKEATRRVRLLKWPNSYLEQVVAIKMGG